MAIFIMISWAIFCQLHKPLIGSFIFVKLNKKGKNVAILLKILPSKIASVNMSLVLNTDTCWFDSLSDF